MFNKKPKVTKSTTTTTEISKRGIKISAYTQVCVIRNLNIDDESMGIKLDQIDDLIECLKELKHQIHKEV